jgi:hypothetical protein
VWSARTIYQRVSRFDELGMQSIFEAEPVEDKRALPAVLRQAIVQLKAEYPAFWPNELATNCEVRFERRLVDGRHNKRRGYRGEASVDQRQHGARASKPVAASPSVP